MSQTSLFFSQMEYLGWRYVTFSRIVIYSLLFFTSLAKGTLFIVLAPMLTANYVRAVKMMY